MIGSSLRAILNFGHTIGHALESYFLETDNPLTHGEAIAIGMLAESWVQHQRQSVQVPDAWIRLMLRLFPHRNIPLDIVPDIWQTMQQDKKNKAGTIRMTVPGNMELEMQVLEPTIEEIRDSVLNYNNI